MSNKYARGKRPRRDLGRRERHLTIYGHSPEILATAARQLRPPALNTLEVGVVVWAHIPYQDDPDTSKGRPAVVASIHGDSVVLIPVTSSKRRAQFGALELRDWDREGLTRPSGLARRTVTVDRRRDIHSVVGRLTEHDEALIAELTASRIA